MIGRGIVALIALSSPAAAAAQDEAAADLAQMQAIEAAVPKQSWYPEGYYDIRIAAEAEIAATPAPPPGPGEAFNLTACDAPRPDIGTADAETQSHAEVALETARLRASLERLHYPASLYTAPLTAFESERLVGVLPKYEIYAGLAMALNAKAPAGMPPVVAFNDCPPPPPPPPPPEAYDPDRKPAKPAKPVTASPKPAAAPPRGVIFATEPAAGEVLLISAFAFKLCVRKLSNPWDRFACRWNEIETGIAKPMSGRFVYQVQWPDGVVRKGTREIAVPPGSSVTVTFKKVGS